ncbi:motility protein A [Azospirillum sp.]|uniref:motility protein A n=1 Tax=Azospirillum sp. TaxID=34012 RepID=UPI002D243E0C|nr:MotA/TolQ/ExbB proton channel family protein [Azospirillum sp.]HYF84967.1 MotA/TolQ/ExbB proton channel family protein [Azospirillum sp.]
MSIQTPGQAATKPAPSAASSRPARLLNATAVGLLGAVGLLSYIGLGHGMEALWNPTGAVIIAGGIAVSALMAFRASELRAALAALRTIFRDDESIAADIAELVAFSRLYQRGQIQRAEEQGTRAGSPFLRLGLQLIADGTPVNDILHVMNWRIQKLIEQESVQSRLFRTLAGLAPAFGLLATLVGLIGMMAQLGTATIAQVGEHMSVALVATLYGVVLANLVFKPIAIKLEQRTARRVAMLNVLLEGIILVRLGRSPTVIADALAEFVRERGDELHGTS